MPASGFGGRSCVAGLAIGLVCVNFMNLATARSARRSREVGMRKVVGARRTQLILQFLTESFLLAFVVLVGAIGLVTVSYHSIKTAFTDPADSLRYE